MTRKRWFLVAGGIGIVGAIGYTIHIDPWKDSILFQRLISLESDNPHLPIDLLASQDATLLSADHEADALLKDDFVYESAGTTSEVVLCGNWVFPSREAARFLRDGSILRGDNYVYLVEMYVDEACGVSRADGGLGPVPFF